MSDENEEEGRGRMKSRGWKKRGGDRMNSKQRIMGKSKIIKAERDGWGGEEIQRKWEMKSLIDEAGKEARKGKKIIEIAADKEGQGGEGMEKMDIEKSLKQQFPYI